MDGIHHQADLLAVAIHHEDLAGRRALGRCHAVQRAQVDHGDQLLAQVEHTARIRLECLERSCLVALDRFGILPPELQVETAADAEHDAILQLEDFVNCAVNLQRTNQLAGEHLRQLYGHANTVAKPLVCT